MKSDNKLTNNKALLKEWHTTKNIENKLEKLTIHSDKKVWWKCKSGHEWEATVSSRTMGSGCPYCSNRLVNNENCLAKTHPIIAKEWHPSKNRELTPNDVVAGSSKRVWWVCEKGHEWETKVLLRKKGTGCPYCSGRKVCEDNCLAHINPILAKEWHSSKNGELTPNDVVANSSRRVWWMCNGKHEWEAPIRNRNSNKTGCPYCTNQKIDRFNTLAALCPEIATEWHPTKNTHLSPTNVSKGTGKKVWWKCEKGHEWKASVTSRTNTGSGCPHCTKRLKTSFAEQAIYYYLTQSFNVENRYLVRANNKNIELDIFIPELAIAIEYDGYYHKDLKKNDERKSQLIKKKNVDLIRVRKEGLPVLSDDSFKIVHRIKGEFNSLNDSIKKIYEYILSKETTLNIQVPNIDVEKDRAEIIELMGLMVQKDNVKVNYPHVAADWHPTKNGKLKPMHFSKSSGTKVWWMCEKGHEWEAVIASRTNGVGCPICSKNKIILSTSLQQKFPDIALEWHPTKNENLIPSNVGPYSSKKIWWKCKNGHEWGATVSSRTMGSGCPYCSNRLVNSENCLAKTHPIIAKEWHPSKNGELTSNDVVAGSRKKVWWICEKRHEWKAKLEDRTRKENGCPYCSGKRLTSGKSLADINPFLVKQWNYTKNQGIGPTNFHPNSNKKVWWICEKDHEWIEQISVRNSRNYGCPYCSNRRLCEDNCLSTTFEEIAKEWHPFKNGNLTPREVRFNSTKKVWWMCEKGHEWENTIKHRTGRGQGCPYCFGRYATKENCLSTIDPVLSQEWHPIKNNDLYPEYVKPTSGKRVWWQCENGHEWEEIIKKRHKGKGCPICGHG